MQFFRRLLAGIQKQQMPPQTEVDDEIDMERVIELVGLGLRVRCAMETERRLASYVEQHHKLGYQDQTLLAEWRASRAHIDRAIAEYVAAFAPYRAAAARCGSDVTRGTSVPHGVLTHAPGL